MEEVTGLAPEISSAKVRITVDITPVDYDRLATLCHHQNITEQEVFLRGMNDLYHEMVKRMAREHTGPTA